MQLGNIQTMWMDFWMFSTPSPPVWMNVSVGQPPLISMWIFICSPPPFISKILGFFWNFWIQILHRFDSSVQMFFQDLLIPNCLVFTSIWVYKNPHGQYLRPPSPCGFMWLFGELLLPPWSSTWFMDVSLFISYYCISTFWKEYFIRFFG